MSKDTCPCLSRYRDNGQQRDMSRMSLNVPVVPPMTATTQNQTTRDRARERMAFAKRRFTEAAQTAIYGGIKAVEKAEAALAELNAAREELARAGGES